MVRIVPITDGGLPSLAPGLVWDGVAGDLAINALDHPTNPGDLWTEQQLATGVLICLMTDRRADESELRDGDVNRGWPGDAILLDQDDEPLGSKLWLLRRSALVEGIALKAEDYGREALQTLIDQGACVRVDVSAAANRRQNRLDLDVALYGRDGTQIYQQRYGVLWDELVSRPLDPR